MTRVVPPSVITRVGQMMRRRTIRSPGKGERCRACRYGVARFAIADVESVIMRNATAIVASTARPPLPYRTQLLPLIRGYGLTMSNTR